MAAGCGANCAKWTLFVFNLIFWVTGAAILGVGIYMRIDPSIVNALKIVTISSSDKLVPGASIVLICVGLFIFITGFLGCCGAVKENGCMLLTYAGILILILILQVVAGILAAVFRNKIDGMLRTSMNTAVKDQYGQPDYNSTSLAWDTMQIQFRCCGSVLGVADWKGSKWSNGHPRMLVPSSCCVYKEPGNIKSSAANETLCEQDAMNNNGTTTDYLNGQPCHDQLFNWLRSKAGILIGVAFGLVVIQIAGAVLACCLRKSLANQGTYA